MTPFMRMLVIVGSTLVVAKITTLWAARAEGTALGPRATAEFFGWMGMRPRLFAKRGPVDRGAAAALALHGLRALALGALLFATARLVASTAFDPPMKRAVVTIAAMIGMSLMLHFGIFDLIAAFHRLRGIPVGKLFRAPLLATSLSEFWSRRWNIGFSEMIALVVHRPLRRRLGERGALAVSFLASGLLHELAISLPVRAGYGLPTTYFLVQGALVMIERKMPHAPGHFWTMFWIVAPLPLLFHPPFLRGIIWPLLGLA